MKSGWCHFSKRLERSRKHRQVKGAEKGFEDEKFTYLIASKLPTNVRYARVLSTPIITKPSVELEICHPKGEAKRISITRRDDSQGYKSAKKIQWGDRWAEDGE